MVMPKLETLFSRLVAYSEIKLVGYTAVFTAAGASLIGSIPAGPAAMGGAFLGVMTTVGPALATVESSAMAVGVAATMTPFLP